MTAAGLAIGGVFVLAMIGVSTWAWRALPPDVRIPVHSGIGGYDNFRSKTRGLITWPVGGVVIYGVFLGVIEGVVPRHGSGNPAVIIIPIVLAVVLVAQVGAIRAALRQPRSR
jgi:hypothetical protein